MKHRDPNLTVAYLYPGNPGICTARFEGVLFASIPTSERPALELADGRRIELHTEPIAMPNGATPQRQWLPLGDGNRLEIYHTPGHSPCNISLRVGSMLRRLVICPLPPTLGARGLDGWNHADFLQTLHKSIGSWKRPSLPCVAPGMVSTAFRRKAREKLRLMEAEASNLTNVPLLDAERITALKTYVDELLERNGGAVH